MSEINGENSRVSYSVKELLGRIDRKLESIDLKMDLKADVKDVDALSSRVDAQGQRMASIEHRVGTTEELIKERIRSEGFGVQKRAVIINACLWLLAIGVTIALSGGIK